MPPRLTRPVIVNAAFEVLDEVGIDGLTVRALAAKLEVKAPALYWHLDSKQALLDEMGTEVAARIQRTLADLDDETPLADALHAYADAMRSEYLRHRDGARTFSGTRLTDPELLRHREGMLARWVAQGHSIEQVSDAFEVVTAYVVGFVIEEQERSQSSADRYDLQTRDEIVGADHPLSVASGHRIFSDPGARFAQQLDLIIPALARLESAA
ncbi:MAG: TetR/AcrR family transcriptional regulator C-terminal domain-containing protein [Microlunatus sp.]